MNKQFSNLISKPWVVPAAAGVFGFVAGATAGYIYDKRKAKIESETVHYSWEDLKAQTFHEEVSQSINNSFDILKEDQILEQLKPQVDSPADADVDVLPSVDFAEPAEDLWDEEEPLVSVFREEDKNWDWDKETAKRSKNEPYIIHEDEYMANDEAALSQMTVTYYSGDDILADESDTPIYNWKTILGPLHFGHGSGDANTFYVRNENMKHDYEIIRDGGKFSEVVLGLEEEKAQEDRELKHSRNLRFRPDD